MLRNDTVIFQFTGPWGVRVEVGQSLGMLVLFLVVLSGGNILSAVVFAGLLILSILLHELGHAWGCLIQNIPVRRVMLHGGGGFCEHARSPSRREQEFIVIMGPLVNLALWAIAGLLQWVMWSGLQMQPTALLLEFSYYLYIFGFLNLALFLFNLVPVQPLDGGKLLHLMMLRVAEPAAAQRITGTIGLALSAAWIPAMIYVYVTYGWILFFIPSIPAHYRMMRGQLS